MLLFLPLLRGLAKLVFLIVADYANFTVNRTNLQRTIKNHKQHKKNKLGYVVWSTVKYVH